MVNKKMIAAAYLFMGCAGLVGDEYTTTGPNVRVILAPKQLTSQTGIAIMGEAGEKMTRVNATVGYQVGCNQRLKLSIDQLCQKLTYDLFNGKKGAWVQQIAGGGSYKCFLNDCIFDSIDFGGWYSNAPNRSLSPVSVVDGSTARVFKRKISGSEAWHGSAGTTLFPWAGSSLCLAAVYDHVEYHRRALQGKVVSGFGVAIDFNQRLFNRLDFNLKGDILKPYQHVGGTLNWMIPSSYGDVYVGIYGDYTHGRKGLPSDTSFGVQFDLAFGNSCFLAPFYKKYCMRDKSRPRQDLLDWISDPAVLMPIVLAVADECSPPRAFSLPDVFIEDFGPYTINVSGAFLSGGCRVLQYSAKGLPPGAVINATTGVISGMNLGVFTSSFNVTVMADCICGAATSTFELTLESL